MHNGRVEICVIHCSRGGGLRCHRRTSTAVDIAPSEGQWLEQVGYTDLFHLNGGVERLVQLGRKCLDRRNTYGAAGYNSVSLGHIVYTGGCAADGKTPKDTVWPARRHWGVCEGLAASGRSDCEDYNELAAKSHSSPDVQKWLKETPEYFPIKAVKKENES